MVLGWLRLGSAIRSVMVVPVQGKCSWNSGDHHTVVAKTSSMWRLAGVVVVVVKPWFVPKRAISAAVGSSAEHQFQSVRFDQVRRHRSGGKVSGDDEPGVAKRVEVVAQRLFEYRQSAKTIFFMEVPTKGVDCGSKEVAVVSRWNGRRGRSRSLSGHQPQNLP